ncbi:MAG: trigger factor [Defluviitaleaceae bacterium]|nr:trigger factor [Defluviitaleaceae bacterium]
MQVDSIEKNKFKLTFEIGAERFAEGLRHSYGKNKSRINIPGFRKGKAPRQVIEMHYGNDVFYGDAFDFVLPEAYEEASAQSGLDIIARPQIDVLEASAEKGVVFTAIVYTKPEVGLTGYKGLTYEASSTVVSEDEVMDELKKLQDRNSRVITVTDAERAVENNDIVTIDFTGYIDDEAFPGGHAVDFELTIGSKTFIDTYEEQLIGLKVGESKQVHVTFPEEYHAEELAGKPAMFEVEVKEIKSKELPEIDDDFAADVSEFETIDELKSSIRVKLAEGKEAGAKREKEQAIVDKLIDSTHIDIPEVMIDERVDQMMRDLASDMQARGINPEDYFRYTGASPETIRSSYREPAEKHVRARLALLEVASMENLTASEEDIDAEFVKISESYGIPKEKLMTIMADKEKKELSKDIAVRKALDLIVESAVAG